MLRLFLRELISDWVALVSGIASFLLAAFSGFFPDYLSSRIFFPVAYFCLVFAAYRLWVRQQRAHKAEGSNLRGEIAALQEKLAAHRDPSRAARIEEVTRRLEQLTTGQKNALRLLLRRGKAKSSELHPSPVTDSEIAMLAIEGLVEQDMEDASWRIKPGNVDVLAELLANK
jgi:hypothetical protein